MRKAVTSIILLGVIGTACLAQPYRIAIVKSRTFNPFDAAVKGVTEELKEKGVDAEFSFYDLQGDKKNGPDILGKIKSYRPRLILTVGTLATQIIKEGIEDIPIVFTMVLNPVASGIVPGMGPSGLNITGVSLDISLREQFANFRLVAPAAKRVGVIYNPKESGLVVDEARTAAAQEGLTLFPIPIGSSIDVPKKLELLKNLDGLWMTADSVVFTPRNTEFILLYTLKEKIPFMGLSEEFVKAGALFSKKLDPASTFSQTAELVKEILEGKDVSRMPIAAPKKISLALNLKTAATINLAVPSSVIGKAEVIFE